MKTYNEALNRARDEKSNSNYEAIIQGFLALGVPEDDIKPRENIYTFDAWKALGRIVRKGQHGIKITVFVEKQKGDKKEIFPRKTTVFHYAQTESMQHD